MRRFVFVFWVLSVVLIFPVSSLAAKRVALVIGNGDYRDCPLKNPVNDATDVAAALKRIGFSVNLLTNADQRKMDRALRSFGQESSAADVRLFYYAGHGMQIQGINYLVPVKAEVYAEDEVKYKAVDAGIVLSKMRSAGPGINVVLLDACRNNPFARSFRSSSRGLARMDAPTGTIIAYATAPGSVAADGNGRNGLFTKYLLQYIERKGVALDDVLRRVRKGVAQETGKKQVPWSSESLLDDVYLVGGTMVADGSAYSVPASQSPSQGSLRVESQPSGAAVFVNGKRMGRTPKTIHGLSTGNIRIEALMDGYQSQKQTATIKGGRTQFVGFTLEPVAMGRLYVLPTPKDARVRILNIGPTYSHGMRLKAGSYHVEVSKTGYPTVRRWVELTAGQDLDVPMELKRETAQESSPSPTSPSTPQKGDIWTDPVTGMEIVWVPGGCCMMGQTGKEKQWLIKDAGREKYDKYYVDESPLHQVCVDGFWMGKYEVTRGQFRQFVRETGYRTDAEKKGKASISNKSTGWKWKELAGYDWQNTGYSQDDSHPAAIISWNDAKAFIKWLNGKNGGKRFRLPTEAEWEYAARGGETGKWFWGDDALVACLYCNAADKGHNWTNAFPCDDGYKFTAPVGSFRPNSFGLYDMAGNLWEWCEDVYSSSAYSSHSRNNPIYKGDGSRRVVRGGGWNGSPGYVRSALRFGFTPGGRDSGVGFRLSRSR